MYTKEHLKQLLLKHIEGSISGPERQELYASIDSGEQAEEWKTLIKELSTEVNLTASYNEEDWEPSIQQIVKGRPVPVVHRVHFLKASWFRYAAAVLLLVGGMYLWWAISHSGTNNRTSVHRDEAKQPDANILQGSNKAILTLADGTKMILDDIKNGAIAQQGNTKVIKLDNGKLAYNNEGTLNSQSLYNTISTPRAGKYQIILSDGTKVWLNAASSIRFPAVFSGSERSVEVSGEAYLEVAKSIKQPFSVKVNTMEIQVLGTSFNIEAYADESAIKTTLIAGSIKIRTADKEVILTPGQQAVNSHQELSVNKANIEQVIAWKNDEFIFAHTDLQTMMRQISRQYDVDIVYEGKIPNRYFTGDFSRNMNLSAVLRILERSNVHFKIEGKKIIVTP